MHLIVSASGPPRSWGYALDAATEGFAASLESMGDLSPAEALERATVDARGRLVNACNALVERESPDAHLCSLWLTPRKLFFAGAGRARIYRHRDARPERLTPRDQQGGLLRSPVYRGDSELDNGDAILAGTESAFSTESVSRVATVLQETPPTNTTVIAALMTDPARKAGVGAAALAIRVR